MKINKCIIKSNADYCRIRQICITPDVFLIFGSGDLLSDPDFISELDRNFPQVLRFGCSSSGEISGIEVLEKSIVITAIEFDSTVVKLESVSLDDYANSKDCAEALVQLMPKENLKHLMVLSEGIHINGTDLIVGIQKSIPENIAVTGGLAGDGNRFLQTFVFDKKGIPCQNCISAIGFYGERFSVGYGSGSGWDSFGVERLVTRSKDNILYELDHQPALQLYREFLGERAKGLPASGLFFPLGLRENETQEPVVRTILGINENDQSLVFAGNIPQGAYVKLMKANVDRLITGAEDSAITCTYMQNADKMELAILISCLGRKLVLKQLIEEEVEAVSDVIGNHMDIIGFYSYGEISPFRQGTPCLLHNQTMTITTISES